MSEKIPNRTTAILRAAFQTLRTRSERFTKSCIVGLDLEATLVFSIRAHQETFTSWVLPELAKRYVRRGKLTAVPEGEAPLLQIIHGTPGAIRFRVKDESEQVA